MNPKKRTSNRTPNGRRIVFTGGGEVWGMNSYGINRSQLTSGIGSDWVLLGIQTGTRQATPPAEMDMYWRGLPYER